MVLRIPLPGPVDLPLPTPRQFVRQVGAAFGDPNTSGQAYGLLTIAPVVRGQEGALEQVLATIDDRATSPFATLPRTHFARWVVLHDFRTTMKNVPEDEDVLDASYLIFSACFDGDRDTWLDELEAAIPDEIAAVWSCCAGVDVTKPGDLARYLRHNQVSGGLFYAAYGDWTVPEVRRVLRAQRDLRDLAVRQHTLTPAELQAAFIERFTA